MSLCHDRPLLRPLSISIKTITYGYSGASRLAPPLLVATDTVNIGDKSTLASGGSLDQARPIVVATAVVAIALAISTPPALTSSLHFLRARQWRHPVFHDLFASAAAAVDGGLLVIVLGFV